MVDILYYPQNVLNIFLEISQFGKQNVLTKLAKYNQMMAFTKYDFWHPMDTVRDKNVLEKLWKKKTQLWKNWK